LSKALYNASMKNAIIAKKSMHIAIFTTHPLFQRHFATELEIAQKHLNAGDLVTLLRCDGEMLACETNEEHSPSRCGLCRKSRETGVKLLHNTEKLFQRGFWNMSPKDIEDMKRIPMVFETLEEMMGYKIDNYDIGSSVLSSVICSLKDFSLDVQEHKDLLYRYLISTFAVYRSVRNFLRLTLIDRFYIFNGRMSMTRAILRACEAENVEFYTHECGNDSQTYSLFHNAMPHGIAMMTKQMLNHWRQAEKNPDRATIAAKWFLDRAKGFKVNGYSFVEQQKAGLLPADRNPLKRHIAIFNNGSFEYATVGDDYKNHLYTNQIEGLQRIIDSLKPYKDKYHITIRIHPNLVGLSKEIEPIMALKSDFVTIVLPESPISTYALIEHSEKILVFSSTVGIEAVYFGKPSILAGKAAYQELGGNYTPQTHEELVELLLHDNLQPKDKNSALIYGYFLNTFGEPFTFYEASSFFGGRFNGRAPMANKWLFRFDTLYKKSTPQFLQDFINKRDIQNIQREIYHLHT
jgi:hypothetical protein